ncbi:MAG: tetratricopeptide repeat protein [Vicingaceae bacterium]
MISTLANISHKKALLLFVLCGFLLYGNTLKHEFALDDAIVITENSYTKEGFSGIWKQLSNDQFVGFYGQKKDLVSGGRYRPLSMVLFNIEYELFKLKPFYYHLMNVLWYMLNGFLLYYALKSLFKKWLTEELQLLPLLAALFWFFHPIHTEVVANIKGRDEIMAFSLLLLTLIFFLRYLSSQKPTELLAVVVFYFLALLAKENAVTWLAVFPLAIYFFRNNDLKQSFVPFALIFSTAVVWFFIRYKVVGGGISDVADNLMNDPFLHATTSEKYATIILTLGKYLQLLFFPHPLTFDYYPKHIPIVSWSNPWVITTVVAYLILIFLAIRGFIKKQLIAFGILFFAITLSIASNLLFPIGAFMNERFIYVSSLGFTLILAYVLLQGLPKVIKHKSDSKQILMLLSLLILTLYSIKTISRNPVWKNNLSLSTNDALISVNGAKSNVMAGGQLLEKAEEINNTQEKKELVERSIYHLNRAVKIYPEYIDALLLMGNAQWKYDQDASKAIPYYKNILAINSNHANAWKNIDVVLRKNKNVNYNIQAYTSLIDYKPKRELTYLYLGRLYGQQKNDLNKALEYFRQGLKIAPNSYELLSNMGTVYGLQGNYGAAVEVLEKAAKIRPDLAKVHIDLGLSYYYLGQLKKAKAEFDQAKILDPTINRSQLPI